MGARDQEHIKKPLGRRCFRQAEGRRGMSRRAGQDEAQPAEAGTERSAANSFDGPGRAAGKAAGHAQAHRARARRKSGGPGRRLKGPAREGSWSV